MLKTPLYELHRQQGARNVSFAGYQLPLHYAAGVLAEHRHTRAAAGLFDVSHMGQLRLGGRGAALALEGLLPADLLELGQDRQAYALLTNERGGVLDDLIITRRGEDEFLLVVNAACKHTDLAHLRRHLPAMDVQLMQDRALLALQGPRAREVLAALLPEAATLTFMSGCTGVIDGAEVYVSCSGYTGEDGFELSVAAADTERLARRLLSCEAVELIGLGARDSLRLEAGLCLYGHELNTETTPVAAGLMWSIGRARRADGARPGGFPGAGPIFAQQQQGAARRLVGLRVHGQRPVRAGQSVVDDGGGEVGTVTSACFAATSAAPVAMAYVDSALALPGQELNVAVRGRQLPVRVSRLPFVPRRYFRGQGKAD